LLLSAQTRKLARKDMPPSAFKLAAIKGTGSKRYSSEQIVAATGLEVGKTADDADFKKAAQALGETGAFTDVLYSFQTAPAGTKVEFQVTDNDQLVPVRFDNLVWFSDQELRDGLRSRVPLFQGELPVSGSLADQVSDALQAMLIEKNAQGRVDYLRSAKQDGPINAIVYSVTGHRIRIRYAGFAGAGQEELPDLGAPAIKLQGVDYSRAMLRGQCDSNFLPVYLARGYLNAKFADAQPKVIKDTPDGTTVDVSLRVDRGLQYKLAGVEWSGNSAFPADKLQALLHVHSGDVANAVQLDTDLTAVRKLYGTRGYMMAAVKLVPQMDDTQSTVSYQLQVHEGDVYKMGDLEIQGLDSRTTARLVEEWKIRGGDTFDASYPDKFREDIKNLLPTGDWIVSPHLSTDEKEKTVDVTLRFDPKNH
jgi:outer membrane protein assembly factor BamA